MNEVAVSRVNTMGVDDVCLDLLKFPFQIGRDFLRINVPTNAHIMSALLLAGVSELSSIGVVLLTFY